MNVPRETIAAAFFGLISQLSVTNGGPFTTVSRVYELPANVSYEEDPACFVVEWNERINEQQSRGEEYYSYPFKIVLLAQTPSQDSGVAPGTIMNPLIDAVDIQINQYLISGGQYIHIGAGSAQTLDRLVNNTYIDGEIIKTTGTLFGLPHIVAMIPVNIVTGG